MSETKLVQASSLKPGRYMVIDGKPCVIKDIQTSKPGKHGSAKYRFKATDIISGSTKEKVQPGDDPVETPIIEKKDAQVLSIEGNEVELMDMETFETKRTELDLADEGIKDSIDTGLTVHIWEVMGKILIKSVKEGE